ncbi:MAG TPA: TonB family protein [Burkholderiales bacterium]|nr:TonB family protein [Burkholderiales bacterium]
MNKARNFLVLMAILLPGCTAMEQSAEPLPVLSGADPAEAQAPAQKPSSRSAVRFAPAKDISAYKGQVAQQIVKDHAGTFAGELPPILKSIVVLDLTVDRDGRVSRVAISRSNGFKDLERVAMESVRRVNAFPAPTNAVLNGKPNVRYLETWLFRHDGKFQIRSLVTAPQPGAEKLASAG